MKPNVLMRQMLNGYHGLQAVDLGLRLGLFKDLANATIIGPIAFSDFIKKHYILIDM